MDQEIWKFITYDCGQAKDLATSFLTLVSAILVGTITFSEKIINFPTARTGQRLCVIGSWILFMAAIISAGIAIVFNYNAVITATLRQQTL
jgi:hypothetical protein